MGTSTNGEISFGVVIPEDTEFPWGAERFDGDIEEWWLEEIGFKSTHQPFDEDGEYADGFRPDDPRINAYFDEKRIALEENPVPITLVNYCSGDYPMFVIAVPGVLLTCRRGDPLKISPLDMTCSDQQVKELVTFLGKYGIEHDGEPGWLLTSYWG